MESSHGKYLRSGKNIKLLAKYKCYLKQDCSSGCKQNDDMYVTHVKDLTLEEFIFSVKSHCSRYHQTECKKCGPTLNAALYIRNEGMVPLATLYRTYYNAAKYKSDKAVRCVIQLPVCNFQDIWETFCYRVHKRIRLF